MTSSIGFCFVVLFFCSHFTRNSLILTGNNAILGPTDVKVLKAKGKWTSHSFDSKDLIVPVSDGLFAALSSALKTYFCIPADLFFPLFFNVPEYCYTRYILNTCIELVCMYVWIGRSGVRAAALSSCLSLCYMTQVLHWTFMDVSRSHQTNEAAVQNVHRHFL